MQTPENKLNLGVNYTIEFSEGELILGGTYTFTDEQQAVVFAQEGFRSPSNEVVDLRALWKDADDRFTIIAYLKNAFDELAYQDFRTGAPSPSGIQRTTLKPNFPRTYGVELQYRF